MKVLYISVLTTEALLENARKVYPDFNAFAVQKFNRLITEGLSKNGHDVTVLSTFYVPGFKSYDRKAYDNGVNFNFIKTSSSAHLRHIWITIYCFFRTLLWGVSHKKDKVLIADVLTFSACLGAVTAAKLIGLRRVGIVTDLPSSILKELSGNNDDRFNIRCKTKLFFNKSILLGFTHYVFLTEQMNQLINRKCKPFIVMEGLVDSNISLSNIAKKYEKKVVIYAGGLYEKYGIKKLIDGFIMADVKDSVLWFFGNGNFVEDIKEYQKKYETIEYKGICSNEEVVECEKRATILVNPRPTNEEFTKYSFPSKNLEYMLSGTPILTTMLPGMPSEYNNHVYLFEDGEDIIGYSKSIRRVLSNSFLDLQEKGKEARHWVIRNKNNIKQASRIIDMVTNNVSE